MLFKYTKTHDGKTVRQAEIYTQEEHPLRRNSIDPDALRVTRRLSSNGHVAYVVGGAVRDLMIGKRPKDFDIATDASPSRIRRLFRNSRVIGKRFRLVHIVFKDKVIEVSTFRSADSQGFQNEFGGIEEDAMRRDFSFNALYYAPDEERILDYVGGVRDIHSKVVMPVIPIERIFTEDPVRMVRAIKYTVSTGFRLATKLKRAIRRSADLLATVSPSRMTEEVFKILLSGNSAAMFEQFLKFDLLKDMLPEIDRLLSDHRKEYQPLLLERLRDLDAEVNRGEEDRRARGLAYLLADYLYRYSEIGAQERIAFREAFAEMKRIIAPIVPANKDVEMALVYLIRRRKNYLRIGKLETTPAEDRAGDREPEQLGPEEREPRRPASSKRRRRSRRKPAAARDRPSDARQPRDASRPRE